MKKLLHLFGMTWQVSPGYVLLLAADALTAGGKLFLNVILPKFLIDELTGSRQAPLLVFWGTAIVLQNVLLAFVSNTLKRVMTRQKVYVVQSMKKIMGEKIMNLEYSCLEDPYYLDLKERAVFAIGNQDAISQAITCVSKSVSGLVTLLGLAAVMAALGPVLLLILLAGVGGMLFIYAGFSKIQVSATEEMIPINRKYGYYLQLGFDKAVQKDVRLYGMEPMLEKRLLEYSGEICDWFTGISKKQGKTVGGLGVMNEVMAAACYGYVGLRTISEAFGPRISLGSLTMYVSAAINFTNTVFQFGESVIQTQQMLSFLDPYMEFMSLPEAEKDSGTEPFEGPVETIVFDHVDFTYPKAERPVLCQVSFSIRRGEKISIVGLNGAGKSTLVKLLCRMYRPNQGVILVNGKDIRSYEYNSYMEQIAAVFQDYRLFNFTIRENISCEEGGNASKIERLTEEVGLGEKIRSLKLGLDSRFGREYEEDGVELSGGEGQKIAIARALYKEGSLVILDEPASALDPIAEAEIYEKFNSLVEEKTAVYISHRMSSSVFCDRILVLENGRVEAFDTHEALMKDTGSLYYKLFQAQAENYRL